MDIRKTQERLAKIRTQDIDSLAAAVAAAVWNELVEKPQFSGLQLADYPGIFEAVLHALQPYEATPNRMTERRRPVVRKTNDL